MRPYPLHLPTRFPGAPIFNWRADTGQLPPNATYTSSSTARTYFDASGTLQTAGANVPRFSYSGLGVPGKLDGLLIESAITNNCLRARGLNQAAWTKTNTTAALDQTGIDGAANSASSLTASAGNGTCLQSITNASQQRTFSCYVKRITGTGEIDITLDGGTTWTSLASLPGGAPSSSQWTRYQVTQTVTNSNMGFRIVTNGDKIAVDYCQNQNNEVATSPISTAGANVTTTNDILTVPVPVSGLTECTIRCRYTPYYTAALAASARNIFSLSDGSVNNRMSVILAAGASLPSGKITVASSSVLNSAVADGGVTAGAESILFLALGGGSNTFPYGGPGAYVVSNQGTPKANTPGGAPVGMTTLGLGVDETGATGNFFGCIKEITIWPFNLDAQQALRIGANVN